MNELDNLILVCDTREKSATRIKKVTEWFESQGGYVEHDTVKLGDYHILGEFRDISVNLIIEYKTLSDFATSYSELSDKLARSYQLYDDVALFVEAANYTFTPDADNFHAIIDNSMVRNGNADVLPLAVYENMLASFQREGIHVRQLRSEAHFPYTIAGLLINITKPIHTGLEIDSGISDSQLRNAIGTERFEELKKKRYIAIYRNVLSKFPNIGAKRAEKIMKHYPAMEWLCSASSESLEQVMGKKEGRVLDHFIRCHDLVTDEWRNNYHRDGTEKDEPTSELHKNQSPDTDASSPRIKSGRVVDSQYHEQQKDRVVDGILCSYDQTSKCDYADPKNRAECKHPDHFKHHPCQFDDEKNCAASSCVGKTCPLNPNFKHSSHQDKDITSIITHHPSLSCDTSPSLSIEQQGSLSTHDINSSHPGTFPRSVTPHPKPDDLQRPPINRNQISEVKQESPGVSFSPAQIHDTSYLEGKTEYKESKPNVIDLNTHKMNLDMTLKEYMTDGMPHLMQDIVDYCEGWGAPYIFDRVMANVKSGNIKKIAEQDGKITYQRIT